MSKKIPKITEVYRMLLQEESHKDLSKSNNIVEPMTFAIKKKYNKKRKKPNYLCEHCKIEGHSSECCFKIHGYSNKNKPNSKKYAVVITENIDIPKDNFEVNQFGSSSKQFANLLSFLKRDDGTGDKVEIENATNLIGYVLSYI